MTVWVHELVKVAANGKVSTAKLTVEDDDPNLTSLEPDAVYSLNGVALAATPFVDAVSVTGGWAGKSLNSVAMHFAHGGADYYMLPYQYEPDAVTYLNQGANYGEVGSIGYIGYGFSLEDGKMFQGDAFVLTYTGADFEGTSVQKLTIHDDDALFSTNGENGFADTEMGGDPVGIFGDQGSTRDVNVSNAGGLNSEMALVNVGYTGPGGSGTFEGVLWNFSFGSSRYIYIVPRKGSVDFDEVTDIDNYAALGTAPAGETYAAFGLTTARTILSGGPAGETLMGLTDLQNDRIKGNGGNDTLLGRIGEDRLEGGAGNDKLYGGHHEDILIGGGGRDKLFGGLGDDTLKGGGSGDVLKGGWGSDRLEDGKGNDRLFGGAEADLFIMVKDGRIDRIKDYEDGRDKIDLSVGFGALTLTDLAPGKVRVQGGGDTLIVQDLDGVLTAADLTASDFI